jgi:hypothetical protein
MKKSQKLWFLVVLFVLEAIAGCVPPATQEFVDTQPPPEPMATEPPPEPTATLLPEPKATEPAQEPVQVEDVEEVVMAPKIGHLIWHS